MKSIAPRAYINMVPKSRFSLICVRYIAEASTFFLFDTELLTLRELGSFRGKSYFYRCSISANGKYICLMLLNGRCQEFVWTSLIDISDFTVKACWIVGDSREGGGIFEGDSCKLNICSDDMRGAIPSDCKISYDFQPGSDRSFYSRMLLSQGWSLLANDKAQICLRYDWLLKMYPYAKPDQRFLYQFSLEHSKVVTSIDLESVAVRTADSIIGIIQGELKVFSLSEQAFSEAFSLSLDSIRPAELAPLESINLERYLINPTAMTQLEK